MLEPYPGCPTLSWMIAQRVCNKYEDSEAWVSVTGRKGAGKSTASNALAESIADDIARIRGKGEPASKFFDASHIRSVTEQGMVDLLSSGALQEENSVWIIDDGGTQVGNRSWMSLINRTIVAISQISRIYKNVIILNFISSHHIDVALRGLIDYRAEMQFKNTKIGKAYFKFFLLEHADDGTEYKHFLTWHGKRIVLWTIGKPSKELNSAYQKLRSESTNEYIEAAREKLDKKYNGGKNSEKKTDGRIKNYNEMPIVKDNIERVKALKEEGYNIEQVCNKTGLSRYWVNRCLAQGMMKQ